MRKILILLMVCLLIVSCVGCLSVAILIGGYPHGEPGLAVYGGVGFHLTLLEGVDYNPGFLHLLLALIDMPLCMVLDTLLLPITIPFGRAPWDDPPPEVQPAQP